MANHCYRVFLLILALLTATPVAADDIYVSPTGSDQHAGTKTNPLASLTAARNKARSMAGKTAVTVHVADGVYYLPETLVFKPQDSGTAELPIIYQAENEGQAVLSGGSLLALKWKPWRDGIYQAKTCLLYTSPSPRDS